MLAFDTFVRTFLLSTDHGFSYILYFTTSLLESTVHYAEINYANKYFRTFIFLLVVLELTKERDETGHVVIAYKCSKQEMIIFSFPRTFCSCTDESTLMARFEREIISSPVISFLQ